MKADVETCKDLFKVDYDAYEESRMEALKVYDMYHNRQYTVDQLARLVDRGQPAETFNIIKLFVRMMLGYYSTVVNTAVANPTRIQDVPNASVLNDVLSHVFRTNKFVTQGDRIKLDAFLSGVMCAYKGVTNTGKTDKFGRQIKRVVLEAIDSLEIVLDAQSRKDDYTDATHIHRFKWLSEDQVNDTYGKKTSEKLWEYYNHLNIEEAEFEYSYNGQFTGHYKIFNNYLIVNTIIKDSNGKTYSIHWCDTVELFKKEITGSFPYRVQRLQTSNRTEHYGIFREVIESQKAINQALIKIQLMVNTQKAFVEEGAVESIEEFTDAFNRVNAVIPVNDLNGIKIENAAKEILDQYTIIDKAFDRIQRVLGINDSFLGMAFASDSGRKVKLQQNATIVSLHYLTNRIKNFYMSLGEDVIDLIKRYYTANDVLRITDEANGQRWVEINRPMEIPTDSEGGSTYAYEFVENEKGEFETDLEGNYLIAPIPEPDTEIRTTEVEVTVDSTAYNDEDEKNQLMMETVISGNIGQMLSQVNPAGYFKVAALSLRSYKTRYSPEISRILEQTSEMLGGDPEAAQQASMMAQGGGAKGASGSLSSALKLPQNTNEGVE